MEEIIIPEEWLDVRKDERKGKPLWRRDVSVIYCCVRNESKT